MILKSLYDYATSHSDSMPPKGLEWKEIEFIIVIDKNGEFKRFESTRIDKRSCARFLVAKGIKRTSGAKSNILWDNGKYVLGMGEKAEKAHLLFRNMVSEIELRNPDDDSIKAVSLFYKHPKESRELLFSMDPLFETVTENLASNFSFRLQEESELVAEKNNLFQHLINDDSNDVSQRCLVTGEYGPIVRTTTPTPLPDNSPMAALVSFQVNSGYDSYGKTQAYNSPISVDAEESITTVIKRFLAKDSKNKFRLGNRMFLFWGSGDDSLSSELENDLLALFEIPDKKDNSQDQKILKVSSLLKGVFSGELKTSLNDRFHFLGLAPNTGRIAVVLWMDCSLKEFASHILNHFNEMEIIDNRKPDKQKPYVGVYSIISAATLGGKISDALPRVVEDTVKAVILGSDYPYQLYTGTLNRIRAELSDMGVTVQRAAFIKAFINRKNNKSNNNLSVMLDKNNNNAGYLCGRLTAVLEKIQSDVNSGDSIRTRYMGAASATPAAVLPAMLNLSLHHSEKLSEGSRIFYEQLKQEIIDKIPDKGFPAHLDLSDQGRFFVGYYHQRADLFTKKEK